MLQQLEALPKMPSLGRQLTFSWRQAGKPAFVKLIGNCVHEREDFCTQRHASATPHASARRGPIFAKVRDAPAIIEAKKASKTTPRSGAVWACATNGIRVAEATTRYFALTLRVKLPTREAILLTWLNFIYFP